MTRRYPFKEPTFKTQTLYVKKEGGPQTEAVKVEMHHKLYQQVETAAHEAGKSVETFLGELVSDYRHEGQHIIDHQSVERLLAGKKPPA